jgi:hypothetical protein
MSSGSAPRQSGSAHERCFEAQGNVLRIGIGERLSHRKPDRLVVKDLDGQPSESGCFDPPQKAQARR